MQAPAAAALQPPPGTHAKQKKRLSRLKRDFLQARAAQAVERWLGAMAELEGAMQATREAQGVLSNQQQLVRGWLEHEPPGTVVAANLRVQLQLLEVQAASAAADVATLVVGHEHARSQLVSAQEQQRKLEGLPLAPAAWLAAGHGISGSGGGNSEGAAGGSSSGAPPCQQQAPQPAGQEEQSERCKETAAGEQPGHEAAPAALGAAASSAWLARPTRALAPRAAAQQAPRALSTPEGAADAPAADAVSQQQPLTQQQQQHCGSAAAGNVFPQSGPPQKATGVVGGRAGKQPAVGLVAQALDGGGSSSTGSACEGRSGSSSSSSSDGSSVDLGWTNTLTDWARTRQTEARRVMSAYAPVKQTTPLQRQQQQQDVQRQQQEHATAEGIIEAGGGGPAATPSVAPSEQAPAAVPAVAGGGAGRRRIGEGEGISMRLAEVHLGGASSSAGGLAAEPLHLGRPGLLRAALPEGPAAAGQLPDEGNAQHGPAGVSTAAAAADTDAPDSLFSTRARAASAATGSGSEISGQAQSPPAPLSVEDWLRKHASRPRPSLAASPEPLAPLGPVDSQPTTLAQAGGASTLPALPQQESALLPAAGSGVLGPDCAAAVGEEGALPSQHASTPQAPSDASVAHTHDEELPAAEWVPAAAQAGPSPLSRLPTALESIGIATATPSGTTNPTLAGTPTLTSGGTAPVTPGRMATRVPTAQAAAAAELGAAVAAAPAFVRPGGQPGSHFCTLCEVSAPWCGWVEGAGVGDMVGACSPCLAAVG